MTTTCDDQDDLNYALTVVNEPNGAGPDTGTPCTEDRTAAKHTRRREAVHKLRTCNGQ